MGNLHLLLYFTSIIIDCWNVRLFGKNSLIQQQGQITLQEVEKSIKDLPLPEKVKAIAIYKRYKEIKNIEKQMEKAVRDIEKKYLKLDEPVLNNVPKLLFRSQLLFQEADLSIKKNLKICQSTWMKRKSRKFLKIWRLKELKAIGLNAWLLLPWSRKEWVKKMSNS